MIATVYQLPGTGLSTPDATGPRLSPILSDEELIDASGGYRLPAAQLKALHALGFTRARLSTIGRKRVILDRAHHDAVERGQFGQRAAANEPGERKPMPPNRAALRRPAAKK